MIPRIKPPSLRSTDTPAQPWGKPADDTAQQAADVSYRARPERRRWLGRSSLASILVALAILALWGGRAYQDLSRPSAWDYWKDLYFSSTMTTTIVPIEVNGRQVRAITVKGEIGAAAASLFRDRLDDAKLAPGDLVLLSSPGGRLDQAMIMGEVIRARRLTTMVGSADAKGRVRSSYCASACVLVFAGGTVREAFPGSALGVHQFTRDMPKDAEARGDVVADTQKTIGMILEYMTRMGVSPSILQAMSDTRDIRWLKEQEVFDLKLATTRYQKS
ncbi:MAG: hypothetical protein J0H40_13875 [Rhizobiales bacterium]|nr:hypothetical protein [Hyphomicrobiales bacterium]